jgi:hypothetical protein
LRALQYEARGRGNVAARREKFAAEKFRGGAEDRDF